MCYRQATWVLARWQRRRHETASSTDRVATIRSGTNGVPKLDSSTVLDDSVRDDLFGGPGVDWFLSTLPDVLHGRKANEQIF